MHPRGLCSADSIQLQSIQTEHTTQKNEAINFQLHMIFS